MAVRQQVWQFKCNCCHDYVSDDWSFNLSTDAPTKEWHKGRESLNLEECPTCASQYLVGYKSKFRKDEKFEYYEIDLQSYLVATDENGDFVFMAMTKEKNELWATVRDQVGLF